MNIVNAERLLSKGKFYWGKKREKNLPVNKTNIMMKTVSFKNVVALCIGTCVCITINGKCAETLHGVFSVGGGPFPTKIS